MAAIRSAAARAALAALVPLLCAPAAASAARPRTHAHVFDRATVVAATAVQVASADAPAGAPAQALALLNSRYREPLGLPDATWNDAVALAAQHHADYWAAGGDFGHEEKPGAPGFTGVEPWDRCEAAGAPPCGEVAFSTLDLQSSMEGWMNTPYHGGGLIEAQQIGCGSSKGGSACDLVGDVQVDASDASAPANGARSPVRIWPFDGSADVPRTWTGGEIPDPLASYGGDHDDVGPNLFLYVAAPTAQVVLTDGAGKAVPLLAPGAATAASPLTLRIGRNGFGWHFAFPARELEGLTTYTLAVRTDDGLTRTVRFTTAGLENDVQIEAGGSGRFTIDSGAPNVGATARNTATGASTVLRVTHDGSGTYGTRLAGLPVGRYELCATSGGAPTRFSAARSCVAAEVQADAARLVSVGSLVVSHGRVTLVVTARPPLVGRRVFLTLQSGYRCGAPWCGGWTRSAGGKSVVLRARQTLSVEAPPAVGSAFAELAVDEFTAGGIGYAGFDVQRRRVIH